MLAKPHVNWLKIIVTLAIFYLISLVTPIYLPIILAVIAAFILNPLVNFFASIPVWPFKSLLPRGLAVILTFICAGLLLAVVAAFVFLPFIREFDKFILNLPELVLRVKNITMAIQERANMVEVPGNIQSIAEQALSSAASFSVDLARRIINAGFGFASRAVELIVVPVLTYYFLKDWQKLRDDIVAVFPVHSQVKVRKIIHEMAIVVSNYIRGQVLVSIVIGLMVFTGMYLLDVDYPLVLGLLATITETIPIIGPIIGSVPAILLAYLVEPTLAVKVAGFYLIVHQVENHIVVPNIMGHNIDLHPVVIIISLLVGGQLLGVVGMLLAVPVAALLKVLARNLWYE